VILSCRQPLVGVYGVRGRGDWWGALSAIKSAKFLSAAKVKKTPVNYPLKKPSVKLGRPVNVHQMFDPELNAVAYAELNFVNASNHFIDHFRFFISIIS